MLHVKVGNALDALHGALYLITYLVHLVEVGAKNLDGDARASAREHGIDTVTDGCSHLDIRAGQGAQLLTYLSYEFLLGAVAQDEGCLNLRHVDTERMLVQFGTTRLAAHRLYLGDGKQKFLGTTTDIIRLL